MEKTENKFKTNINCNGCIAKVKPYFDKSTEISEWNVDITNRDKVLTVKTDAMSKEQLINLVASAGYKAESIS
jgi:copper chaperone CopZ